ncbi:GNAT family N-acetyltransferase [Shouchella shacheensis]|uniref:GNAT family N-acetyltransferase n=1 Tax=Shouchella shacheensis TaxID=1649580 RepID=UPI00073FDBB3|nr:GNAT family N-acetyltransferase [Shouchella shacheensis]
MEIRALKNEETLPLDLLLLADPNEKLVREYAARGTCMVAEVDGEVVGQYVLLPTRPGTVELASVAVTPREHGKGIGKALVRHAVSSARAMGFATIEVGTGNSGMGQLALYQKCGFRMVGIDVDFFVRHYDEEIVEDDIQCRDMIRLSQDLY